MVKRIINLADVSDMPRRRITLRRTGFWRRIVESFNRGSVVAIFQLGIVIFFINVFFQYASWKLRPVQLQGKRMLELPAEVHRREVDVPPLDQSKELEIILNGRGHRPFTVDEVRLVLLVTQQRSGSTFLGEIFNQNPNAFYWFEPLDGMYNAMYGTSQGWNVPSDLYSLSDGTMRLIPPYETKAAAETVSRILRCEIELLPTQVLLSHLLVIFKPYMKKVQPYMQCVKTEAFARLRACRKLLSGVCTGRFGSNWNTMRFCYNQMYANKDALFDEQGFYRELPPEAMMDPKIAKYKECINKRRKEIVPCLGMLKKACLEAEVRVVKTVRMSLEAAQQVYKIIPNLRLILNIRNPAAIAVSRQTTSGGNSYMSLYAATNATKEAQLVCRNMRNDIDRFWSSTNYSDVMYLSVYERTAKYPERTIRGIYQFLELQVPWEINYWRKEATKNSARISSGWTEKIPLGEYLKIRTLCKDLYKKYERHFGWSFIERGKRVI